MRALGHSLLWIGFVGAAFFAVSRLEQTDKWSTISWPFYGGFMFVGVVGIVLLRKAAAEDHVDHAKTDAEYSVLQESLEKVAAIVDDLLQDGLPPPGEVVRRIDNECTEPLSDFAESRQALVKRFDIQVFAEVMTEFASAERYINRAWSASADGYVDEAKNSLEIAQRQLRIAKALMDQAEQGEE